MSEKLKGCKVAPGGEHCLHAKNFYWQWNGTVDRMQVCCWCGQDIAVHGDFLPTYQPNTWCGTTITTNTIPAANGNTTTWVNVPTTFTANGTSGQFYPSGSVGTGG